MSDILNKSPHSLPSFSAIHKKTGVRRRVLGIDYEERLVLVEGLNGYSSFCPFDDVQVVEES